MSGCLIAVVGPSGAGKDAVIAHARERFADDPRVVFPQRVITRPAGAGEEHLPAAEDEFERLRGDGAFALHWDAHGLRYGIPVAVTDHVAAGRAAVVNVSRAVLADLAGVFPRSYAVRVTVPDDVRRERILSRGRETSAAALARLHRPDPAPGRVVDLEIVNDGALHDAGESLVAFLTSLLPTPTQPHLHPGLHPGTASDPVTDSPA